MTAHELARKLLELPDLMVTVRGYESGVNEITSAAEPAVLKLDYYDEWYYGKHEYVYPEYEGEPTEHKLVKAIHIG